MLGIDITLWITGAILVVGITEYIKDALKFIPSKYTWIYSIVSAILCVVVGYYSGGVNLIWDILGILTCSQLGYAYILQTIKKRLKGED